MKYDCDVIRDLLPLYADKACSDKSREIVEEHLQECMDCRNLTSTMLDTEIERTLHGENESVIQYGARQFRRRSAIVGSAVSGSLAVPILVCLILNLAVGPSLSWVSVVIAALCVLAALVVVPLTVREDKAFWTFCAFTASLLLLLGVTCLYSHGRWFGIAASAVLFGLSVAFLPFLIRARPLRKWIAGQNRLYVILGTDAVLFVNLLAMISTHGRITVHSIMFTLGILAAVVCVAVALFKNRKTDGGKA